MLNPYQSPVILPKGHASIEPDFSVNRDANFVLPDIFHRNIIDVQKYHTKRVSMEEEGVDTTHLGDCTIYNMTCRHREKVFYCIEGHLLQNDDPMTLNIHFSENRLCLDGMWYMRQVSDTVVRGNHSDSYPWYDYIFTARKKRRTLLQKIFFQ